MKNKLRTAISRCAGVSCVFLVLSTEAAFAQAQPDLRQIMERLDRLEQQNRELLQEIHELKNELAANRADPPQESNPPPSVDERLQVEESRTAELAQSKVEAAHRFPIRLTGMVLFNSYLNSQAAATAEYPTLALPGYAQSGGAGLRQTILGFDFTGPRALDGGKISGSLRLDLFGGSGQALDQLVRLRTATIGIDWKDRGFTAGIDKPIISPREPDSLAQVGVSPLTGAGNLWLWIPQVRFQQDLRFGEATGLRAQFGVVQTHELNVNSLSPYSPAPEDAGYFGPARPGLEARLEFFRGTTRRFEVASGIHHAVSHVAQTSVPSDVYSVDWLFRPWQLLELTGTAFTGRNIAPLGTGGIRQGFIALGPGRAFAVHSRGGWAQLTLRPAPRLWFNLFSGQQDDTNRGLPAGAVGKNLVFGSNVFYRIAPNVLASFEASQTRTAYIVSGTLLNNHYDLALAYLF